MSRKNNKILISSLIIATIIISLSFNVNQYISLESLKENQILITEFVSENYFISIILFITIYILAIALQIPLSTILTITGGALFGYMGVIYVNIGATIGGMIGFLLSRYLLQDYFNIKFEKQLKLINSELAKSSTNYLLFIRLVPGFPFFLANILLGLTNIKLKKFIWTTSLGIIIGSFVYVYAGTQLTKLNSTSDIVSPRILLVFIFLSLLSISPVFFKRKIKF